MIEEKATAAKQGRFRDSEGIGSRASSELKAARPSERRTESGCGGLVLPEQGGGQVYTTVSLPVGVARAAYWCVIISEIASAVGRGSALADSSRRARGAMVAP